jgi:DUF2075 family protein
MITYSATKREFINQCRADANGDCIANAVNTAMRMAGIGCSNDAQIRAWANSLPPVAEVLDQTALSDNAIVAAEFTIRQARERLDFVITGKDANGRRNMIVVELKQWSTAQRSQKDNFVFVNVAHGHMEDHWHPSYQALNYANIISNTYEIFQNEPIGMFACSYLHNMPVQHSGLMKDEQLFPMVNENPCFLKDDVDDFVHFIDAHVQDEDVNLLSAIDSSNVVSSRQLSEMLLNALHGNPFYSYDAGQATSVETIKETVRDCLNYDDKRTIIIKGGPGTGKSVIALNVLGQLTRPVGGRRTGYNAIYCTVNAAPRTLYSQELIQGDFNRAQLRTFFKYPNIFSGISENEFDCAFFDEAHRLFDFKGGVGIPRGTHILDEAIKGSRVSVFFIDEDQIVTKDDFATIERIRTTSERLHKRVIEGPSLELKSQFRVNGGERYMSFIKSFLGYNIPRTCYTRDNNYEFKIFDTAQEMHDLIRQKDAEERQAKASALGRNVSEVPGYCRVVAGYCYEWDQRRGGSKGQFRDGNNFDIILDGGQYRAKWNLRCDQLPADYSWLNDPLSVNEVGCIHTCQGLDLNYCGVIIGKDLCYRDGAIRFDKTKNAASDGASGIRRADDALAERLIRNTYHVLLTRGMKGTYVYCEDEQLRDYLKSLII